MRKKTNQQLLAKKWKNMSRILMFIGLYFVSVVVYAQDSYQVDTTSISLKQFKEIYNQPKGEVWVVDFWASWCGPCIKSMPYVAKMVEKYKGFEVKIISISIDKKKEAWEKALARIQPAWPQIRLPYQHHPRLKADFPFKKIPAAYLIQKDGSIRRLETLYDLDKELKEVL